MHLKRLELFGFKTFADRTELEFLPGITAVVGPNGSGKSNIADAIQWVLGEQSMRSLRSLSSQDVIFSGTHRRKPLGFAEASLTFDNSDRSLPLDFEEVTVTRRIFRSGESEYAINKVPCRLKDIVELFLDTGVGSDAYAIIGQGEIDAVLSIKSEDRRALLEEAAGIKKYRVRKREATRKLEATQANLARVTDIISEIERQLPPLREQAEVARDYRELRDQAQRLERALLLTEHQRALQQVVQFQAAHKTAADHVDALQAELARLESEAEAARLAVTQADTVLDEARSAYSAASQQVERGRGELAVSCERVTALETAEKNDDERLAELEQAMARCRQQQAEIAMRIAAAEGAEKEAGEALSRCQKQFAEVNGQIASVSRAVEEHRRLAVDRARALTNAQADLRAAQRRVHDIKASAERTAQRLEVLKARGETQDAREEKLRAKVAEAEARCETLSAEIKRAELQRATLQREAHLRGQRIADLRNEITARSARLRVLRELEDKFEGYREGARAVLQAQKKGRLKGHFLPVADLVDVDPEYESAIQAALGGGMDALLADSLADAREAVRYLRQEGGGRATFIVRGAQLGLPRADDPEELIRRCAANLVRCKENYRPLVQALLGDTVLAEHLDEAQRLLSLDHARYRAVTRDGDLLSARGTLTGGRVQGGAGSLLARRREMTTLQQEVSRLEAELAGATKQNENQSAVLRAAETEARRHREASAQAATALAAAKKDLDYAGQERRRLGEEYRKLEQAIEHSHTDVEKAIANENRLQQRVAELQAQDTGADADVEKAREQLAELNRERDQAAEAVSEQKIAAARAKQQAESLRENAARAAQQEAEIGKDMQRRRNEAGARAQKLAALREEIARQQGSLEQLAKAQEQAQQKLNACREERRRLLDISGKAEQGAKEGRDRLAAAQQELHKAEVKLAGVEADIQHARTALYEQYGITSEELDNLDAETLPEIRNRQQASQDLRKLRARMAQMGEVNLGAIEEVQRLEDRMTFLTTQRADLTDARDNLLRVITEIDSETRERFMRTLNQLREAFAEIFTRLFGGGATSIKLNDQENVLDSGLDIIVQPPGKKPQSMLLLSGGERALTAAAFLFALLKIKPSPFVLLDEVDAPMDESNVLRFAAMVREFSENSQFIVISHNKGTMEVADVLYGISMPEPGVSRVISVRLDDVPDAA